MKNKTIFVNFFREQKLLIFLLAMFWCAFSGFILTNKMLKTIKAQNIAVNKLNKNFTELNALKWSALERKNSKNNILANLQSHFVEVKSMLNQLNENQNQVLLNDMSDTLPKYYQLLNTEINYILNGELPKAQYIDVTFIDPLYTKISNSLIKLQTENRENLSSLYMVNSFLFFISFFILILIIVKLTKLLLTKNFTKEIQKKEQFLADVFSSIEDGITITDTNSNILFINPAMEKLYGGLNPDKPLKCHEYFCGRSTKCEECYSDDTQNNGSPKRKITTHFDEHKQQTILYEHYSFPLKNSITGEVYGVIHHTRDITENYKIQQQMARFENLNLIGEIAASIAHEIRNPMTTVRGFLQLFEHENGRRLSDEYIGIMIEELDRANAIITEFLSLAKNRAIEAKEYNINTIIETIFPLLNADAIKSEKTILKRLSTIPDISLDEKEIRQLILNLVRNGLEAMQAGGTLTISTYLEHKKIILEVKDEGTGIAPEILQKIGTPFLTTKENGTGLGLAVCYSIAERHNAEIDFKTGPQGTTFYVRFPIMS